VTERPEHEGYRIGAMVCKRAEAGIADGAGPTRSGGQDLGVVQQPIQEGGDGGGVAEELAPVLDGAVRGDERGGPFIAPHDDLEEILGGGLWELSHGQIVDDEQGIVVGEVGLARAAELGIGHIGPRA
jgi:hypothetical protein